MKTIFKYLLGKNLFIIGATIILIILLFLALTTGSVKIDIANILYATLGLGVIYVIYTVVKYIQQPKKTIKLIVKQTFNAPLIPIVGRYKYHVIIKH